jgi:hypothetical protein
MIHVEFIRPIEDVDQLEYRYKGYRLEVQAELAVGDTSLRMVIITLLTFERRQKCSSWKGILFSNIGIGICPELLEFPPLSLLIGVHMSGLGGGVGSGG